MDWTDKQLQTIRTRGRNVLVSAAAGSGKTAVLTERILRLVTEDRVPLKELLVVTFTEAAASEMRSRIAAALTEASENDEFAETQLRQLGSAKIMTFHAFCLTVLRRYYFVTDLDPSFSIADEKRSEALKETALDEVVAAAFADEDEGFLTAFTDFLLAYADVRDERKARDKILKTYEFIMTLPSPFAWLADSVDAMFAPAENLAEIPAIGFAYDEIAYRLSFARRLTEQTGALLTALGLAGLASKNDADLVSVSLVEQRFLDGDMEGTRLLLEGLSFETFRAAAAEKESFEGIKALVKQRRDRVKEILKKEVGEKFFDRPLSEYAEEIAHVAPFARTLETLVKRFSDIYTRVKREENVIDFSDFEHTALRILEDEDIADDYRRRFSYIFIDEYQDSNYVQEALVSRISRADNVFMVGDVKQSIYSWRNAAPEIFLEKQRRYRPGGEDGAGPGGEKGADPGAGNGSGPGCEDGPGAVVMDDMTGLRIDLSSNFRSKAGVIDAVNAVFETVMERRYSGMDYDTDARLVQGVSYDPDMEGRACLHLIKKDAGHEMFDSDAEGEAALCAAVIRETVGKDFYDAKHGVKRPIRYGDIAILLRAARGSADVYRRTLEAQGIPAATDRGEGYFETVEIDTFLSLLRAIVNPRRDVPLAASMCSAVFGFGLPELADIRAGKSDGFFYTAFLDYAENGKDAALREKCEAALARLAGWRDEERFMRLDDFLWKLMRESGFYEYVSGLARGANRQANLRALLDRAADFQRGRVEGLRGFLAFLDRIKLRGGAPQVTLLKDGEDVCRIMTIHGSKGLEFPVVFLGGLGKPLSASGFSDDSLLFHRDAGLSLQWRDHEAHTYKETLLHRALKLKLDVGERAEAIRLLYVGMTRAMDTLHMIGTLGDPEKWVELFGSDEVSPVIDTDIVGASNYLQLVLPTALKRSSLFEVSVLDMDCLAALANEGRGAVPVMPDSGIGPVELTVTEEGAGFGQHGDGALLRYPYEAASKLKSKYSVTGLGGTDRQKSGGTEGRGPCGSEGRGFGSDETVYFMAGGTGETDEDAGLSAAEKGTALHRALELLDVHEARAHRGDRAWFETFLSGLAEAGALSGAETESIDVKALLRFADSDLAARAAAADFMLKEAPFNMKLPYGEAIGALPDRGLEEKEAIDDRNTVVYDEEIVVQGVIDFLFEEDGGLVLVDYKSGWFDTSSYEPEADRIRSAYGYQLRLYRRAAELAFGKPVKESLIYMTRAGVTVDVG